jgi:hypothetical protein
MSSVPMLLAMVQSDDLNAAKGQRLAMPPALPGVRNEAMDFPHLDILYHIIHIGCDFA